MMYKAGNYIHCVLRDCEDTPCTQYIPEKQAFVGNTVCMYWIGHPEPRYAKPRRWKIEEVNRDHQKSGEHLARWLRHNPYKAILTE